MSGKSQEPGRKGKVGRGSQAVNFIEQSTLEQGVLEDWLSTDGGRAAIDSELGLRQPPSDSRNFSKTHPSNKTIPKSKTEGRPWRYLA